MNLAKFLRTPFLQNTCGACFSSEEQPLNPRQQYVPRKQLTRNRKVHDIDSSLDEANFEKIIYVNREGNFEEYVGYLGPKTTKNKTKIFFGLVNDPSPQVDDVDVILL